MERRGERGEGRVGFLISLVVPGVAIFTGVKVVPARIAAYEFKDYVREQCRFAGLWDRLGAAYGEARREPLAKALVVPAPFDLRANVLKTSRDEALAALTGESFRVAPTPYAPHGLRIAGRPMLARHPWLADGRLEVQDEGSQLVAYLVAPKRTDLVVDFCAGAGGKTLALGALMRSQGRLYALDVDAKRLANLKPRLARSGLSNVQPEEIAHECDSRVKRLAGKADRVLVDAPCTGTGTLRRRPEKRDRLRPEDVAECAAQQAARSA